MGGKKCFGKQMNWTETSDKDGGKTVYLDGVPYVRVAKSRAISKGEGLFAARSFRRGDVIAMYDGVEVDEFDGTSQYVAQIKRDNRNILIDGEHQGMPYPQKINDGRNTSFANNASLKSSGKIVAMRYLGTHDEILMSYGNLYWKFHAKKLK